MREGTLLRMQKGLPTTAWNGGVRQLMFRRSVFTLVTSNAGSVYTYVTSEVPNEATSLATIITSGAGGAVSTIVSAQRLRNFFETHVGLRCIHRHVLTFSLSLLQTSEVESIGTEVTSIGGSAATVGLNLSQSNSILPCSSFSPPGRHRQRGRHLKHHHKRRGVSRHPCNFRGQQPDHRSD